MLMCSFLDPRTYPIASAPKFHADSRPGYAKPSHMSLEIQYSNFPQMSLQHHPPFSIKSKPISLQNPSQKIDFGLKFPILMSIPKTIGSRPQKSRILCPQPNKHLLEWRLDWISRQEKSGFPANMSAGASFFPPKVWISRQHGRRGFLFPLRKVWISRQHARRVFPPRKVRISRQHARRFFCSSPKVRISCQHARRVSPLPPLEKS